MSNLIDKSSLPLVPYVFQEGGDWFVAYKDKNPYIPYVTISSKGIANGMSNIINDGADFGPDSYDPNAPVTAPPYSTSDGLAEALQYAIDNPISNTSVGYFLMTVKLIGGMYHITAPQVLHVPYRIMNLTLIGQDTMNPYISCDFDTTADDTYPYAFNFDDASLKNITYIDITWSHFQMHVGSNHTPYGFVKLDFSSINNSQNTFVSYDINVSNPGFTKPLNLLGFQEIHMFDFQVYGEGSVFDAGYCEFIGGYSSTMSYVGGASNGIYLVAGVVNIVPAGDINKITYVIAGVNEIGIYDISATFTINELTIISSAYLGAFNYALFFANSGGTITIGKVTMYDVMAAVLSADTPLVGQQGGGSHVVNIWDIRGLGSDNSYKWINIPYNTPTVPSVPSSGTAQQNTNTYPVMVYIYGGDVSEVQYTPRGGSAIEVGTSSPMTVRLNEYDSITLTYSTAPTWEWVAI